MQKQWEVDATTLSFCRRKESWSGSYYELSIAYKDKAFTRQEPVSLMNCLWSDPSLLGVVKSPDQFGQQWQAIDLSSLVPGLHFYGCIHLSTEQIVGCGSLYTIAEDIIWLTLYIPLSMLERIFPVHYPVTREKNPWMTQLEKFLGMIGNRVYQASPFLLAVMGEEATAFPLKSILTNIAHDPSLLVPETTFQQVGVNPYGARLSEGLWWTGGKKKKQ